MMAFSKWDSTIKQDRIL